MFLQDSPRIRSIGIIKESYMLLHTKWKGFGFQTDRKSFLCYVVLNWNFNICIKKKKRTKKQESPSIGKSHNFPLSWVYTVISANFTTSFREIKLGQTSVPRPHVNNCVHNTLLGWAESALPPNTTLTESAWNPISSLRSGGIITPEQNSGLFYHTWVGSY